MPLRRMFSVVLLVLYVARRKFFRSFAPRPMWYNCYIVLLCDLSSISRKAIGCGKIRNALLVSKRSKRYGRILTIWIAVQTFPNNSGRLDGSKASCTP